MQIKQVSSTQRCPVRHETKEINPTLIWVKEFSEMEMILNRGMCKGDTLAPPNKPIEQVLERRRGLLSC